ncbi:MAG: potassium channel isoform [Verrucomicrobiales bacterium]|nr:potassium channel isoform [Verrucomicrobiales bacterium]
MKKIRDQSKVLSSPVGNLKYYEKPGWLLLPAIYFLGLQPLLLFLVPLVRYDEFRLPAVDSTFLLTLSASAWRNLFITFFGIRAGLKLLQRDQDAAVVTQRYLVFSLLSSVFLLLLPFVIPFHSFLRKPIRMELAQGFFEAALILVLWTIYAFLSAQSARNEAVGRTDQNAAGLGWKSWSARGCIGLILVGSGLSLAALFTKPLDIFEAAWDGDAGAVRKFVRAGVDVNSTTSKGNSPLHLAQTSEIVEFILSTGSQVKESYLVSSFDLLDLSGFVQKLRLGSNAVSLALRSQLSATLLEKVSNAQIPVEDLRLDLIEELNRFIVTGHSWPDETFPGMALSKSTSDLRGRITSSLDMIRLNRLLLDDAFPAQIGRTGIDIRNALRETPLHLAAFDARLAVSASLIEHGASVNTTNRFGLTPLDHALFGKSKGRKGDFDSVIALLESKGAKANSLALVNSRIEKVDWTERMFSACRKCWFELLALRKSIAALQTKDVHEKV